MATFAAASEQATTLVSATCSGEVGSGVATLLPSATLLSCAVTLLPSATLLSCAVTLLHRTAVFLSLRRHLSATRHPSEPRRRLLSRAVLLSRVAVLLSCVAVLLSCVTFNLRADCSVGRRFRRCRFAALARRGAGGSAAASCAIPAVHHSPHAMTAAANNQGFPATDVPVTRIFVPPLKQEAYP